MATTEAALLRPMHDKVQTLQDALAAQTHEQIAAALAQTETTSKFADGMYCRILARKKGITITGKVHKKEHFYIVAKGCVAVTNGDEPAKVYEAGDVIVSQPGTKRAVVALEDSICLTVHRTDKTDLAEIEDELVEPDAQSPIGPGNTLKALEGPKACLTSL